MRVLLALVAVSLALGACAKPQAAVVTEPTVLQVPSPPPRVVVPPEPEPDSDVPVEEPEKDEARPPRRLVPRPDSKAANPVKPGEVPPVTVEPPKPATPTQNRTLQPVLPASTKEVEAAVSEQLRHAEGDLGRVDYEKLSADARAQYDMAKRFIAQARQALTERSLVLAGKLAEKAANIAGVLVGG